MRPSAQRYCPWCTAPALLLGPDVHFHSPAPTHEEMGYGIREQCRPQVQIIDNYR